MEKAEHIRDQGGMALVLTHPDYLDERLITAYRLLLARFGDDPTVWRVLPRDVNAWWRRRAASRIEQTPNGWQVVGPAAGQATIAYTTPR